MPASKRSSLCSRDSSLWPTQQIERRSGCLAKLETLCVVDMSPGPYMAQYFQRSSGTSCRKTGSSLSLWSKRAINAVRGDDLRLSEPLWKRNACHRRRSPAYAVNSEPPVSGLSQKTSQVTPPTSRKLPSRCDGYSRKYRCAAR